MNMALTSAQLMLILFCIITDAAREYCFKYTAHDSSFAVAIKNWVTWLGILLWAIELIAWTVVLEQVNLGIAFPLMALSYVLTVLMGALAFKEPINARHLVGALLITIGVACVGSTGM